MSADEKTEKLKGKAKEVIGKVTGNEELEAEGKAEQLKAKAKEAGENVKETFEDLDD